MEGTTRFFFSPSFPSCCRRCLAPLLLHSLMSLKTFCVHAILIVNPVASPVACGLMKSFSASEVMRRVQRKQETLALASMTRDDSPASSTAAAIRGKVGSEFET